MLQDAPDAFTIFWQFIIAMIVEDIGFYWGHKAIHHPNLYWMHKIHHQHYNTVCFSTVATHPLDYIITGAGTSLGLSILSGFAPVHFMTMIIWITYRAMEACDNHCGYEWSWSCSSFLPFKLDSDYHNFHHIYNSGNYGSMFAFWDNVMGTNIEYKKFVQKHSNSKIQ